MLQLVWCDVEFVFEFRGNGYWNTACENRACLIRDVAWLGDQDFIADGKDRAHGKVERLADADGHKNVGCRVVSRLIFLLVVVRDFLAQLHHAAVCRVRGVSAFETVDTALADRPRRDEVRLADTERDDVFHLCGNVEEFADAGWRNGVYARR